MPLENAKVFQVNLSYDLNVLRTLKSGGEVLQDRNRERITHAVLLEGGYSFTRRLSVDALLSFVRQERNVNNFGTDQFTSTQGVGDATILTKYLITDKEALRLFLGLGAKIPVGASDRANDQGITLNADLQPGSGAWDGITWISATHAFKKRPSAAIYLNSIYSLKGHNTEYLGSQDYQFGAEWQLIMGYGDQILLANQLFDPGITLRYRHASPDQNNDETVPSTGGQWLFVNPSLAWWIDKNLSWNINVEVPLHAHITGTQVTPTYRFNTGIYYRFSKNQKH